MEKFTGQKPWLKLTFWGTRMLRNHLREGRGSIVIGPDYAVHWWSGKAVSRKELPERKSLSWTPEAVAKGLRGYRALLLFPQIKRHTNCDGALMAHLTSRESTRYSLPWRPLSGHDGKAPGKSNEGADSHQSETYSSKTRPPVGICCCCLSALSCLLACSGFSCTVLSFSKPT